MKEQSKLIRTQVPRSSNREHSVPLYLTSSFVFDDSEHGRAMFADEVEGNIYSRYSNPNTNEFIEKVRDSEGAEAGLAFSSGMAAVFASIAGLLRSGDHIVAFRSIFDPLTSFLRNCYLAGELPQPTSMPQILKILKQPYVPKPKWCFLKRLQILV